MAKKGKRRHMKGLNAPSFAAVHRKEHAYVTKPNPGRHSLDRSVALVLLARKLRLANTKRELKRIIESGAVLVNGKAIREEKYPVGLNDTVEAGKKYYKIWVNNHSQIALKELQKPDYDAMLYKVIEKYKAPKNMLMLRLHDGTTISGSGEIKVNDSVVLDGKKKIIKTVKLEVGSKCSVVQGVHSGTSGTIKELIKGTMHRPQLAVVEQENGNKFETLVKNIMVVT